MEELDAPPQIDVVPLEGYAGFLLLRAQQRVYAKFTAIMHDLDLVPAQFALLTLLRTNAGIMPSRAALVLGIQKANFVRVQAELERRGLVERDALDGRSFGLHLTPAGKALLRSAKRLHKRLESRLERVLGTNGEPLLRRLLWALVHDPALD